MDPRLRAAVHASLAWYVDVFAVHGIPTDQDDGLWWALDSPPAWHSAAKTLHPDCSVERVLAAVERFDECTVADSFGSLDLGATGFDVLIDAQWLHHRAPSPTPAPLPQGWSVVRDRSSLDQWNRAHDTTGVLSPALLSHPRFRIMANHVGQELVAGAVLHHAGPEVVGLSNAWSRSETDYPALLSCVAALFPGTAVVDYASGDELRAMVEAGFDELGRQVVWIRGPRADTG